MKKQDMILYEMKNLDVCELEKEQLEFVVDNIIDNVKISDLEKKIHEVTLQLAHIGPAKFGVEMKPLFMEDETRLNLIYMLNSNFDNFKASYKYMKRHRFDYDIDSEQLLNLIMRLKDVVDTIYNYGEFTLEQRQEQEKYMIEQHKEWVKLMEEINRKQLTGGNK